MILRILKIFHLQSVSKSLRTQHSLDLVKIMEEMLLGIIKTNNPVFVRSKIGRCGFQRNFTERRLTQLSPNNTTEHT